MENVPQTPELTLLNIANWPEYGYITYKQVIAMGFTPNNVGTWEFRQILVPADSSKIREFRQYHILPFKVFLLNHKLSGPRVNPILKTSKKVKI